jgi:uncharacterized protein
VDVPRARASKDGVIFEVHVIPSSREESVRCVGGSLKVKVAAPADKGKANKAVVKALKPYFGACEIISGETCRNKTVHAPNMDLDGYNAALRSLPEA